MSLGAKKGEEVAVVVDGPDEKEAAGEIRQLFIDGAGI